MDTFFLIMGANHGLATAIQRVAGGLGLSADSGASALLNLLVSRAQNKDAFLEANAYSRAVQGEFVPPREPGGPGRVATNLPDYEPERWNDGFKRLSVQITSNCYAYACNLFGPFNGEVGVNPGEIGQSPEVTFTDPEQYTRAIREQAVIDGLSPTPIEGGYPVYLVIDPGTADFHWYRLDSNNLWSHKLGPNPVTNKDASGALITDPSKADRNYQVNNYSIDGGYLWVPPGFRDDNYYF